MDRYSVLHNKDTTSDSLLRNMNIGSELWDALALELKLGFGHSSLS